MARHRIAGVNNHNRRNVLFGAAGLLGLGAGAGALMARKVQAGPPLDLSKYRIVFEDEFTTLDITARGPGSKWTAHTPWNGDFGDAAFTDPQPDFPFTRSDTGLRITARKGEDGQWRSGLIASADADGNGFGLQYGYFEMRAKFPPGPGLWPAFWLDSLVPKGSNDASIEIDVVEYYGQFPRYFHSTVIVWPHDKGANRKQSTMIEVTANTLCEDFHTYGVSVDKDWIVTYLDRKETWRTPTPPEHRHKLIMLVDLAMGGGWPIAGTPSPSVMDVDYVRAYAPL